MDYVVELKSRDDKKHSVKFFSDETDPAPVFNNLYIAKSAVPKDCKGLRVTVEFIK